MDQHTGGNRLLHSTKRRKDNQLMLICAIRIQLYCYFNIIIGACPSLILCTFTIQARVLFSSNGDVPVRILSYTFVSVSLSYASDVLRVWLFPYTWILSSCMSQILSMGSNNHTEWSLNLMHTGCLWFWYTQICRRCFIEWIPLLYQPYIRCNGGFNAR